MSDAGRKAGSLDHSLRNTDWTFSSVRIGDQGNEDPFEIPFLERRCGASSGSPQGALKEDLGVLDPAARRVTQKLPNAQACG